jgi:hypothetical protein
MSLRNARNVAANMAATKAATIGVSQAGGPSDGVGLVAIMMEEDIRLPPPPQKKRNIFRLIN